MYKFDNNEEGEAEEAGTAMSSFNEAMQDVMNIIVRLCGLILLFIGLWIAIQVFNEALALYKDPASIERVAAAIEAGSNIDKSIAPIRDSILGTDETIEGEVVNQKPAPDTNDGIRISYFVAWIVDLLLLLLLARISIMAVKTGGELALYDTQIKKFAKQIVKANKE